MTSMFWGLRLEPGKRYSTTVDKSFHVSMAALDVPTVKSEKDVQSVMLEEGESNIPFILCNLQKPKVLQCHLDLNFVSGDRVTFFCRGNGAVHLTGYLMPDDDDDDDEFERLADEEVEEEEDDEEEEDEEVEVDECEAGESKKKGKVNGLPAKRKADVEMDGPAKKKNSLNLAAADSDDSDEEEDDSQDEDEGEEEEEDESEDESENESEGGEEESKKVILPTTSPDQKNKKKKNKGEKKEGVGIQQQQQKQKAVNNQVKAGEQEKKDVPKKTLEGGVVVKELKPGSGAICKPGRMATVYYTGRLKSNNKVFDSSLQGPGFKFRVGRGEVIKAWDVAVAGMKVGGKRLITCPPSMAYGAKGSPPTIPPNSTLIFEIELKAVN